MTSLYIDPSEIKLTDAVAIRDKLMRGGAIPKPVLDALMERERAVSVRESKVANSEIVLRGLDIALNEREAENDERAKRLFIRETTLTNRETEVSRREAALLGLEQHLVHKVDAAAARVMARCVSIIPDELGEQVPAEMSRVRPTLKAVVAAVAKRWGMSTSDLISDRRTVGYIMPRRAYMALARELTLRSTPEIGRISGGKDHTTVLHHLRMAEPIMTLLRPKMKADADLSAWVNAFYDEVNG